MITFTMFKTSFMLTVQNSSKKINERIAFIKETALADGQMPNSLQKRLERIYGKTTPEIINRYSTFSKEWGKFIDID